MGSSVGEVEFWVYDDGLYETDVSTLAPGETYFYRTLPLIQAEVYGQKKQSFIAEDKIAYESGKLFINTSWALGSTQR